MTSENRWHYPTCLDFIFTEETIYYFRNFFSDLEIAETFENTITDAPIRSRNLRLKKELFFYDFFGYR